MDRHTRAQSSHTSVGLAQAHPNYNLYIHVYIQGTSNLKAPAKGSVASFFAKQGQLVFTPSQYLYDSS